MSGRRRGLALLVVALLGLLVLPSVLGRRVAGSAEAAPVPDQPSIGTCLESISGGPDQSTVASPDSLITFPSAVVGACTGQLAGEVVSVDPAGSAAARVAVGDYMSDAGACDEQARRFIGLPATGTINGVTWTPRVAAGSQRIGPDGRQRAAGQHWSACVVTGAGSSYVGSLRSGFDDPAVQDVLGLCWAGRVSMNAALVSCSAPHRGQLLAAGTVSAPGTVASVDASCAGYARLVTGRTIGAADHLELATTGEGFGSMQVFCSVTADTGRTLTGSLVGLGTRPLPWTG